MLFRTIFAALPVGQEMLEAITALIAVAMLFYVSFWLIARLEHKRWLEFVKARMWSAVSVGSAASLMLVGFTAVYREGFETALFYQALISFGTGPRRLHPRRPLPRPRRARGRRVADVPARAQAPDQDVHERRGRARDGDERRLPRQRGARAAGRRPCPVHAARRVAATADLPLRGDRLLADACRPSPRRSCSPPSTSWARIYVFLVKPRLARRAVGTSPDRADRRSGLIAR